MTAHWFKHDSDARHDLKLKTLLAELGYEGIGIWWSFVEILSEQEGYVLNKKLVKGILIDLSITTETFQKFITTCLEIGLLKEDKNSIYSESLQKRLNEYDDKKQKGNERVKRYRSVTEALHNISVTHDSERYTSNSNSISNSNSNFLEKGGAGGKNLSLVEPPPEPEPENVPDPENFPPDEIPPDDELLKIAYSHLEKPEGQHWTRTNAFIGIGRRPMKKYPEIFISPTELKRVFETYESSGLPKSKWKNAFLLAESRIKTKVANERILPHSIDVYSWLTNFILTDLLGQVPKEVSTKNSIKFMEASR